MSASQQHAERFFVNVVWSLLGFLASFASALILSPYLIRTLGEARYGVWVLAFSLIEYFLVFDLGFRSAVVNQNSRLWAAGDRQGVVEIINTTLAYFLAVSVGVVLLVLAGAGQVHRFLMIRPELVPDFTKLLMLTGISWAAGVLGNVFQASLEAFQEFRTVSRIGVLTMVLRTTGCFLALWMGLGLFELGLVVVGAQMVGYLLTAWSVKRILPELSLQPAFVKRERWRSLFRFGIHSFGANTASMLLTQMPPILVGHFRPEAQVGYYSLPTRLLQYAVDVIARIGFITAPNTAQLAAQGRQNEIARFGMYLNRYCFMFFVPLCVFLLAYGRALLTRWLGPNVAEHGTALLLPAILANGLAVAGQFNSSSILFGLGRHATFGRNLIIEAACLAVGLFWVIPRYGIEGAAWTVAILMLINRGLGVPWLLCRYLGFSFWRYMSGIYAGPLLASLAGVGVAVALRAAGWAGRNWFELVAAGAAIALAHLVAAWWLCLEPEHRQTLWLWVGKRIQGRLGSSPFLRSPDAS